MKTIDRSVENEELQLAQQRASTASRRMRDLDIRYRQLLEDVVVTLAPYVPYEAEAGRLVADARALLEEREP